MKTIGIRIRDKIDKMSIKLPLILEEIHDGNSLYWTILYIEANGDWEEKIPLISEKSINKSENGFNIKWEDLNFIANCFFQIKDIVILGDKNIKLLRRHENDQEMYEACGVFIEMVDCSFWEVFSKDEDLIYRLAAKFKKIEFLESDFVK